MNYLFVAMLLLWLIVLLYVVFLVNKQRTLESQLAELEALQEEREQPAAEVGASGG